MEQNKQFLKDAFVIGFLLWLLGYILGILLFNMVPTSLIGWIISPVATVITLWVLVKKIKSTSFLYFLGIGIIWTIIAVVLDYVLIVKAFKPEDGYYKLDVYLYYVITFILPMIIGLRKQMRAES